MSPSDADVLATFRARVNMTADELAAWLDDPESADAGTGVGLDSGRRILAILRKNPKGDPKGYDEVRACVRACARARGRCPRGVVWVFGMLTILLFLCG